MYSKYLFTKGRLNTSLCSGNLLAGETPFPGLPVHRVLGNTSVPREYIEPHYVDLILQLVPVADCGNLEPRVPLNRQSVAVWLESLP